LKISLFNVLLHAWIYFSKLEIQIPAPHHWVKRPHKSFVTNRLDTFAYILNYFVTPAYKRRRPTLQTIIWGEEKILAMITVRESTIEHLVRLTLARKKGHSFYSSTLPL